MHSHLSSYLDSYLRDESFRYDGKFLAMKFTTCILVAVSKYTSKYKHTNLYNMHYTTYYVVASLQGYSYM